MRTKYTFKWTANEDYNEPNNNYNDEIDYIICEDPYDFGDWLRDNGVTYDQDGDTYYVLDDDGNRTGAAYLIVSVLTEPDDYILIF